MEEELNLAYMSVYTGKAGSEAINSDVSLDEIYNDASLSSEVKSHIIQIGNANTIRLREGSTSNVTILAEAGAITSNGTAGTNTVNIEIEEVSNSNVYWLESEGVYYPMSIANGKVVLDKENTRTTAPTGAGNTGNEIGITFLDNGAAEATESSSYVTKNSNKSGNITTITLTASNAGSTQLIVKKGNGTEVGEKVEVGVTVTPVYTINFGTMTNGSIGITTNGVNTTSNTKYGKGVKILLTATGTTRYEFDKWSDNNSTTNPREITINATTTAVTYIATFSFKLYGAQVQLNEGNSITVKESNTIDDNWRLFYIDDASNGYVHLIYGNYYPADVQTEITTNNEIFAPAIKASWMGTSSTPWAVNSGKDRLTLLKYLKNNSSYAVENLDTSTPTGSYDSWINLASALTGTGKALAGKTILVQGAPNITMWVNSWNEQGYAELALDNTGNNATGYNTRLKTWSSNSNYSLSLQGNGSNDKLYFPTRSKVSSDQYAAYGYWLASPGGYGSTALCCVKSAYMYCIYSYGYNEVSARPVVSILKSDFQTLFPNISIEK